jgi:hypothetical protein
MQVDHHFYENLTPGRVDEVFAAVAGGPPEVKRQAAPKKKRSSGRAKPEADDL